MNSHKLHSGYFHSTLRKWQNGNIQITKESLMYPVFVVDSPQCEEEISSMPGVFRYGYDNVADALRPVVNAGLKSVLIFGVVRVLEKDEVATNSDSAVNPVILSVQRIRKEFPDLLVACDVCLCAYTTHGHCAILREDGSIDNDKSIQRIALQSLAYAQAGAQIIAPSDMMDCRIGAIKTILNENGYGNRVSVLSYAAKFASSFYGPFRDAANSAPAFGDRRCYQLPGGSSGLAMRAVVRDVEEGADFLMVKPGLAYLDIVRQVKDRFPEYPLFIYQVSGEYAMIYHGAKAGAFDLKTMLTEVLVSMRRAGGPGSGKVSLCNVLSSKIHRLSHIDMETELRNFGHLKEISYQNMPSFKIVRALAHLMQKKKKRKNACIISGFPRNMRDVAEYLKKLRRVDAVILLDWEAKSLERQLTYAAGEGLVEKSAAMVELNYFVSNVSHIAGFFDQVGFLHIVSGDRKPDEIYSDLYEEIIGILARNRGDVRPELFPVPDDVESDDSDSDDTGSSSSEQGPPENSEGGSNGVEAQNPTGNENDNSEVREGETHVVAEVTAGNEAAGLDAE